jgi:hypothetical protein
MMRLIWWAGWLCGFMMGLGCIVFGILFLVDIVRGWLVAPPVAPPNAPILPLP